MTRVTALQGAEHIPLHSRSGRRGREGNAIPVWMRNWKRTMTTTTTTTKRQIEESRRSKATRRRAQNDVERRWDRRQIQQQQTAHNVRERVRQTGNYLPLPRGRVLLPKLFDTPPTPPPTGECEEFLHVISQKATTVAKIRQLNYCLLY